MHADLTRLLGELQTPPQAGPSCSAQAKLGPAWGLLQPLKENWKNNLSLPPRPPYKHRKEAHIPNSPCISSLVLPDAVVDTGLGHTGKDTQGSLGHMGGHSMQLGPRGGTRSTAWATWGDTQRSLGHMHEDTARPGPRRFLSQAFFLRFQVALLSIWHGYLGV